MHVSSALLLLCGGFLLAVLWFDLMGQLALGIGARGVALASLALAAPPILLAALRVIPNARRLGARTGSAAEQSALARSICRDHQLCFAGVAAFVGLQLWTVVS